MRMQSILVNTDHHSFVRLQGWLESFSTDFKQRLLVLLAGAFREMPPATALSLLQPQLSFSAASADAAVEGGLRRVVKANGTLLDAHDLKRLQVRAAAICVHSRA